MPYCIFNSRLEYKYSCLSVILIVGLYKNNKHRILGL